MYKTQKLTFGLSFCKVTSIELDLIKLVQILFPLNDNFHSKPIYFPLF